MFGKMNCTNGETLSAMKNLTHLCEVEAYHIANTDIGGLGLLKIQQGQAAITVDI